MGTESITKTKLIKKLTNELTKPNKTTANKVLPKAGLNGFDWTFVQGSTFVLRLSFCASISPPSAIPEPLWRNRPSGLFRHNVAAACAASCTKPPYGRLRTTGSLAKSLRPQTPFTLRDFAKLPPRYRQCYPTFHVKF